MSRLAMEVMEGEYSIHRLAPDAGIPPDVLQCAFFSVTRTKDELSLVCPKEVKIAGEKADEGWACLKVVGPLDLNAPGVLAGISAVLAEARVSIFAISTYDTDYILVKRRDLEKARASLESGGFVFERKDGQSGEQPSGKIP